MIPDNKPFPIRLGVLKKPLQKEAVEIDRSLHWLIKKVLANYILERETSDPKTHKNFRDYETK